MGFIGSFHCVGMCGPIALALPLNRQNTFTRIFSGLLYNTGRVLTYATLGMLFGLLGKGFIIAGYQQVLSIALGSIILLFAFFPQKYAGRFSVTRYAFAFVSQVKTALGNLFKQKSYSAIFSIGVLNGLLPCGLVYLGVAGAIATGMPIKGALFMAAFGLGTLPAMLAVSIFSNLVSSHFRSRIKKAVPVFVVAMAGLLILRGLNLGIPYVSPQLDKNDCTKHVCCRWK